MAWVILPVVIADQSAPTLGAFWLPVTDKLLITPGGLRGNSMAEEIYLVASSEDFTRQAIGLLAVAGTAAVAARGRFTMVLTGGRTVQPLYQGLSVVPELQKLLCERTEYFWGDERMVPATHPDSNFGLARRLFLDELRVPAAHQHPVATAPVEPGAACIYEKELRGFFADDLSAEGLPIFDLVLLGLGPDGHVASLFPGSAALVEQQRWAVMVAQPGLAPMVPRVTLTLPVLNQARMILILAAGAERIALARRISRKEAGTGSLPAARLCPAGRLVWLLMYG